MRAGSRLAHVLADFRQQHTGAVGLGYKVVAARRMRPGFILAKRVGRDRNDRDGT